MKLFTASLAALLSTTLVAAPAFADPDPKPACESPNAAGLVTAAVSTPAELTEAIAAGVGNVYVTTAGVSAGVLEALPKTPQIKDRKVGVSIDEEGGKVARLKGLISPDLPAASELAGKSAAQIEKIVTAHAKKMAEMGLTRDYAPVVDVGPSDFLGTRVAGDSPKDVVAYAKAFAAGLNAGGISATLKHFPGHGSTNSDTHQTAGETASLAELKKKDLIPYARLLKKADPTLAVMVGHLTVPGLTEKGKVTSISPATMALLRTGVGYDGPKFDGMIVTDDLSGMKAVLDVLPAPQAAVEAVKAGADSPMITWSTDGPATVKALKAANLPKERLCESLTRIEAARAAPGEKKDVPVTKPNTPTTLPAEIEPGTFDTPTSTPVVESGWIPMEGEDHDGGTAE